MNNGKRPAAGLSVAGIFLGGAAILWVVVLSGNAVVIAAGSAFVAVGASLLINFILRRSRDS